MIPRLRIPSSFPQTGIREAFGRDWIWPVHDKWGWQHPLDHWPEMERLIKRHVPDAFRGTVVQAGGCCGMYPWLLARMFKSVLTFEPDPHNFHCLVQNCATPQVRAFNCGLGDIAVLSKMKPVPDYNVGNGHVDWEQEGDLPILPLDELHLPRLDALLLDAESSEERIIIGALMTIDNCQPKLVMAETITHLMVKYLHDAGYDLQPKAGYDHHFLPREGKATAVSSSQQSRRSPPAAA